MEEIKFRLRDSHNNIIGYEKFGYRDWLQNELERKLAADKGYWVASPCWLYSTDNNDDWSPDYIEHVYKDQYAGKKDKNGVDYYTGDILRYFEKPSYKRKTLPVNAKVVFSKGIFKIEPTPTKWNDLFFSLLGSQLEIIGNEWKNPELIAEVAQ